MSDTLASVGLVILVVSMRTGLYFGVGQIALAYLCMWLALRLPFDRVDRFGDFSYGIYIYAFPIEQLLALYGVYKWGLVAYLALSLIGSLAIAIVSWFVVEKRFLTLKKVRLQQVIGWAVSTIRQRQPMPTGR